MSNRRILTVLALVGAAVFSAPASAVFITEWSYTVDATFGTPVFTPGSGGTSATPTLLSWGTSTGSGQSSLGISNTPTSGSVFTNGALEAAEIFTHTNNPITGNSLDSVPVNASITLQGIQPIVGGVLGPATNVFTVNFTETSNGGPCVVGSVPCPDIFVLSGNLNIPFAYEGESYFLSFVANGLSTLPTEACTAAGSSSPCNGFITQENAVSTAQFFFTITGQPIVLVPEPGSLALAGLALVAIVLARRRRS